MRTPSTDDLIHHLKVLGVPIHEYRTETGEDEELAQAAGYTPGAGAFNNPRGRLRSLGLVEYTKPGWVMARPILFL